MKTRVLFVDDEPSVAGVLCDVLRADGHHIDTADNGVQALARLQTARYDLILSDAKMPELDGPGLYRALARWRPALRRRFVLITGDTLSAETEAFQRESGVATLGKPFVREELRRVVAEIVDGGGAPEPEPRALALDRLVRRTRP